MRSVMFLPTTRTHLIWAGAVTTTVVVGFLATLSYAGTALQAVAPFLPIFSTTIFGTEGMTALLLAVQFLIFRHLFLGALSGAYAFVAMSAAIQLLVFPGVFSPKGLLGAGPQSAVWIWVFWHGGFAFFVLYASLIKRYFNVKVTEVSKALGLFALTVGLPIVTSLLLCYLAIANGGRLLPPLVLGNSYGLLLHSPYAIAVVVINIVALISVSTTTRWKSALDLWVSVALVAALLDVTLTLNASARYTLGWYAARCLSLVSSTSVLSMLVWEVNRLYRDLDLAHQKLTENSVRDGLTGVFNRSYFDERHDAEFENAMRSGKPLSVLMADVDWFKAYNDNFGHQEGDRCLIAIALALGKEALRYGGFTARYGGEEFVTILPNTDRDAAITVAESMRNAVLALAISAPGDLREPSTHTRMDIVTVSIGGATSNASTTDRCSLLEEADQNLYVAKKSGRNRVSFSEPPRALGPSHVILDRKISSRTDV